jgi:MSHA biogenesis protein MshN
MSLINKMLRDLDARRSGEGERAALPAAVTPLAARQEPSRAMPILLVGGLTIVVALGGVAWYGTQTGAAPRAPSVPATPIRAAPPAPPAPVAIPEPPTSAVIAAPAAADSVGTSSPAPMANVAGPSLRLDDVLSAAPAASAGPPRKDAAAAPKPVERASTNAIPPKTSAIAAPRAPSARSEPHIEKQVRLPPATERAETEYRRGLLAQRQGSLDEAAGMYRSALADYPEHAAARQTLAALLIDTRRFDEAEELLRKGTELPSVRLASTLALARLKVERNQAPAALDLLQKHAAAGDRSAEYQGFAGALLNRAGRTAEAVEHYQAATRLAPNEGRWWAGLGIALDAAGKAAEAREAYQKARALPGLPADLAQHIEQRLR